MAVLFLSSLSYLTRDFYSGALVCRVSTSTRRNWMLLSRR